jgi:hypothetical protein
MEELVQCFPDSKIIIIIRDPREVIPSSMSLIKGLLQKLFGFDSLNEASKKFFYRNLYLASLFFYKSLHEFLNRSEKLPKNLITINYKDLKQDFAGTMNQLLEFLELEKSGEVLSLLAEQEKKQKSFKSLHEYALEDFGLLESKIKEDFKFIYDNYKF